ncbi:uncharacterized protein LOC121388120 [Gigantopelta aegis]|uniref:uncharacterized protein LOC121388120 n=1 Tax=Gigantopelta aegis TaxID=1735272 RepID=UPI001B8891D9|nr:uncharacterized protein LOC121388120 [Gigantopelta aegis]
MDPVRIEYVKSCGDEWCHQVQKHLLAKGQGRPPSLPANDQNPTYLQLLQIHNMKKETKVSWNQISRAMEKMFGFSQRRFRAVIESAVTKMGKFEFEDMKVQLMSTVDLRYIGPRCAALGIDREKLLNITLLNEMIFPDSALSRGVVYELEHFSKFREIRQWDFCSVAVGNWKSEHSF